MERDNLKLRIFVVFVFLFSLIFLPFSQSTAQIPGEGLTISPPIFELEVKPDTTSEHIIKITNPTENLMEVYPKVMNFKAGGEGGEPAFYPATDEEANFSLAHWISFSQTKLALQPEQVVEFKFQIEVPDEAEPGGHYGVVFFATEPPKPEEDISQVTIGSMIGSLILAKVPGTIVEKGLVEEFSAGRLFLKTPVNFKVRVANAGNIHFKPQGPITIKNWRGKEVGEVLVNEAKGNVLPDSIRKFEEKWSPESSFWKIPAGRFSANLKLTYGESEKTLDGKLIFWIIPWWLLIAVLVVIALVVGLIIFLLRRRRRRSPRIQEREIIIR